MNFKGGYNLSIKGKPSDQRRKLPHPALFHLPLSSKRFAFTDMLVSDKTEVQEGQVLAEDPKNFSVPLLAPAAGIVKVDMERQYIVIENPQNPAGDAIQIEEDLPEAAKKMGQEGKERYTLLRLGAWQYFSDANSGRLPDPYGTPQAVIVSTYHLEPFLPSTEALCADRMSQFEKGLEHIYSVSGNKPVYVALPSSSSKTAGQIKEIVRKHSWIKLIQVPAKYPFDNLKLLARLCGLDKSKGAVWACTSEGVLAVDTALSSSKPCLSRLVSIGGPGVKKGEHVEAFIGYPLDDMLNPYRAGSPVRIINGGVLTGDTIPKEQKGLDVECVGLTLVPEQEKRELLAFAHFGFTKHAYSNTFISKIGPAFKERYTTGIRGEHRPCICCCFCEEVCPSSLMPHLLHKYVNKNRIDEAARFGLNECVQCGLCAHVCTSKIEIKQILLEGQQKFLEESLS